MFWKIKYIVDDGYTWHRKICIINAENEQKALNILDYRIGLKLKGERMILDEFTEITKCDNDVILYNGSR